MPHRQVDPRVFEEIAEEIQNHLSSIKEANVYREDKDRDSYKAFLRGMKSMLDVLKHRKDALLLESKDESIKQAIYMLGRQHFAQEIIESFEDAEKWEKYHKDEILKLERTRDELSKLPKSSE